jgi:alginate O-acetyltransferase complex protein AlgI
VLFNSPAFLFAFLPATLVAYFLLGRFAGFRAACSLLVLASLFYYGWWNPRFLALLVPAILANAALGQALCRSSGETPYRRLLLWAGICGNLALLGYFKYAGFFVANLNALGTHVDIGNVILPLGISFFTFQKIAFIVDAYRGHVRNFKLLNFFLFVSFFPQLIAGPIVHHQEIMPQFDRPNVARFEAMNFSIGLSIFAIGLFKKTIIADGCATLADPVFDGFGSGERIDSARAWVGAVAYAFQLYFDFSGYSDMAVGLARMFNVDLPINFNSPYKAVNIIDFWRRWHITLSRFLRDYLYFPLGGNRKGSARRYANLMVTMLLGGFWHGASWAFLLWGGAHGLMLIVNHAWHALKRPLGLRPTRGWWGVATARAITFIAVVTAWVPFRMVDIRSAFGMIKQMYDPGAPLALLHFVGLSIQDFLRLAMMILVTFRLPATETGYKPHDLRLAGAGLLLVALIAFCAPNVYQLFSRYAVGMPAETTLAPSSRHWSMSLYWALGVALLLTVAIMQFGGITPFLYFQF